jgi:hypothetical protein
MLIVNFLRRSTSEDLPYMLVNYTDYEIKYKQFEPSTGKN